jgi:hypothetical protein
MKTGKKSARVADDSYRDVEVKQWHGLLLLPSLGGLRALRGQRVASTPLNRACYLRQNGEALAASAY